MVDPINFMVESKYLFLSTHDETNAGGLPFPLDPPGRGFAETERNGNIFAYPAPHRLENIFAYWAPHRLENIFAYRAPHRLENIFASIVRSFVRAFVHRVPNLKSVSPNKIAEQFLLASCQSPVP